MVTCLFEERLFCELVAEIDSQLREGICCTFHNVFKTDVRVCITFKTFHLMQSVQGPYRGNYKLIKYM